MLPASANNRYCQALDSFLRNQLKRVLTLPPITSCWSTDLRKQSGPYVFIPTKIHLLLTTNRVITRKNKKEWSFTKLLRKTVISMTMVCLSS